MNIRHLTQLGLLTLSLVAGGAFAQAEMSATNNASSMSMQHCLKGMKPQSCHETMGNMHDKAAGNSKVASHHAAGVVKAVDAAKGTVTLSHGAVPDLNWPAMTMRFAVKDKVLLDKLTVDRKVEFDFRQQGKDYVVTAVR